MAQQIMGRRGMTKAMKRAARHAAMQTNRKRAAPPVEIRPRVVGSFAHLYGTDRSAPVIA